MSTSASQLEAAVFQTILPQLEAEGFEVFLHPSRNMLPAFLTAYQPDAIAFKGDRKIAIEIASASGPAAPRLDHLRELLSHHKDWELRIIYAPPRIPNEVVPISDEKMIEKHLDLIELNFDTIGATAALLTTWATFEAAARLAAPADFGKPQTPARLVEILALNGYITPDEADLLRQLGQHRNEVAHGRLDLPLRREDLEKLIQVTRTILGLRDKPNG